MPAQERPTTTTSTPNPANPLPKRGRFFPMGSRVLRLCWWYEEDDPAAFLPIHDQGAAYSLICPLIADSYNRQALRELLAEHHPELKMAHFRDQQVVELLARRVAAGWIRIAVGMPTFVDAQSTAGQEGRESVPFVPEQATQVARSPAREAPPPEDDTLPRNIDPAVMAAAQKEAARLGIPFCEECFRKAMAA